MTSGRLPAVSSVTKTLWFSNAERFCTPQL